MVANARLVYRVSCLDLTSGKPLWTQEVPFYNRGGIDPRDDSIWIWNDREGWFEQRALKDGAIQRKGELPRAELQRFVVLCLRDGAYDIWSEGHGSEENEFRTPTRFDVGTRQFDRDIVAPGTLEPGGLRKLELQRASNSARIRCVASAGDQEFWNFASPTVVRVAPVWAGRDVLVLAGDARTAGTLYRIDGQTGRTRWQARLDAPPSAPGTAPEMGVAGAMWAPLGRAGDKAWAVDAAARIRFFDFETGEAAGQIVNGATLTSPPHFSDHRMTVATTREIRQIDLNIGVGQAAENDEIVGLRIRSLLALNRTAEALGLATGSAPSSGSPYFWRAYAEALHASDHPVEATAARVHAMELAGEETSAGLLESHGLLKRIQGGPATAFPVSVGPVVIIGETEGRLLTIDPRTCEVLESDTISGGIYRLVADGNKLVALQIGGNRVTVREFARASIDAPPAPPPRQRLGPGPTTSPQPVDENQFRPVGGRRVKPAARGGIDELVDGKVISREGKLSQLASWQILPIDESAVGHAGGAVYALDDELRPDRVLINLDPDGQTRATIQLMSGDAQTIAIVFTTGQRTTKLQIWSRDGSRIVRETTVRNVTALNSIAERLRRVGEGYLLCAAELTYLPLDPGKPQWQFSLNWTIPQSMGVSAVGFGVPIVIGDRLIATGRLGGVFCFDFDKVQGKR